MHKLYRSFLIFVLSGSIFVLADQKNTYAYFSDHDAKQNIINNGDNTTVITEDFPIPSSIPIDEDPVYKKTVEIANNDSTSSSVDCFVRVMLTYSDHDIAKAVTLLNLDQTNWIYNASDGYYYYKNKLETGRKTTPLFQQVQFDHTKIEDTYQEKIAQFKIDIYEESVQAGSFTDYQEAWNYYLHVIEPE